LLIDGSVVSVPPGSVIVAPRQKYVMDKDGHPIVDNRGRSVTVDKDTIVLQVSIPSLDHIAYFLRLFGCGTVKLCEFVGTRDGLFL